ncbi:MAG: DUF1622 domain-containing protein [Chitinispirillaceae bacterium]
MLHVWPKHTDMTQTIIQVSFAVIEILGVGIITLTGIFSILHAGHRYLQKVDGALIYADFRRRLGRGVLLGLEFLVAGDIIRSVTVEPTLAGIGVLAGIVLVRTFLSFTLEVEIKGRWPWKGGGIEQEKVKEEGL